MTLTIEVDAQTEAQLRADALEMNTSLEEMAARWMRACALSDEEWEDAEDAADNEAADAALKNSDPSEWVYLDEVRNIQTRSEHTHCCRQPPFDLMVLSAYC